MRQSEIDWSTLHDGAVIAVVGDSHVYSVASDDVAHTMPSRLEQYLNSRIGTRPVRVLNFGVPGYNMVQELEVLRAKVLQFRPDLIILVYCINDDHISNYIQPKYPRLNRLLHSSVLLTKAWQHLLYSNFGAKHLLRHVESRAPDLLLYTPGLVGVPVSRDPDPAHGAQHPTRSPDLVPARYHEFIGRDNLERAVRTFGEICRTHHIPAVASGFIEDADVSLYRTAGFQVYTFFDMFRGQNMRAYGYDPDHNETHFRDSGNDFIGQALAAYVTGRVGDFEQ